MGRVRETWKSRGLMRGMRCEGVEEGGGSVGEMLARGWMKGDDGRMSGMGC